MTFVDMDTIHPTTCISKRVYSCPLIFISDVAHSQSQNVLQTIVSTFLLKFSVIQHKDSADLKLPSIAYKTF